MEVFFKKAAPCRECKELKLLLWTWESQDQDEAAASEETFLYNVWRADIMDFIFIDGCMN